MFISIVICTKGRPEVLADTINSIRAQGRKPDEIIIVVTDDADYNRDILLDGLVKIYKSRPGSSIQRNVGIQKVDSRCDLVVFLDDDVELASDYLIRVSSYMGVSPWVAGLSGTPLLNKPENGLMSRSAAQKILLRSLLGDKKLPARSQRGLYGCNMVVRSDYARKLMFDERLSLYAWLEDRDFGIRLEKFGHVVDYGGQSLIHFGTPGGRISEVRLGYAQIMNPAYLFFDKKVFGVKEYVDHGVKGTIANLVGSILPEGQVKRNDLSRKIRRKRLKGNLLAIRDILTYGFRPELIQRIVDEDSYDNN